MENFFTKAQGERIKTKAASHPPKTAKLHALAGMLIWKAIQLSVELKDIDKAKEQIVDWYCNASPEEVGNEIFDLIIKVASGEQSKSEKQGLGDLEFVPWQIGATM